MALKDWVSVGISCVALGVSVSTAYFNVFLQKDDLRVVIGRPPWVQMTRDKEPEIEVIGEQELTFINLGNRTAAVTFIGASIVPMRAAKSPDACERNDNVLLVYTLGFDTEPFVIKAGEIVHVQATPQSIDRRKKGQNLDIPRKTYEPKDGEVLLACLRLRIITPDSYVNEWEKAAYTFTVSETSPAEEKALFNEKEPLSILRQTRTIFSN
jgi:hypothetical protein